ncbi:hypothetical protein AAH979_18405 [Plantactinospora sp. ZYX-F-223]|uniref:hypothetical protein n=1 Tax=Plantactinospora sp. ZYX-F-223 TaxID=3144103 RepID=UPI0031FC2C1C
MIAVAIRRAGRSRSKSPGLTQIRIGIFAGISAPSGWNPVKDQIGPEPTVARITYRTQGAERPALKARTTGCSAVSDRLRAHFRAGKFGHLAHNKTGAPVTRSLIAYDH